MYHHEAQFGPQCPLRVPTGPSSSHVNPGPTHEQHAPLANITFDVALFFWNIGRGLIAP